MKNDFQSGDWMKVAKRRPISRNIARESSLSSPVQSGHYERSRKMQNLQPYFLHRSCLIWNEKRQENKKGTSLPSTSHVSLSLKLRLNLISPIRERTGSLQCFDVGQTRDGHAPVLRHTSVSSTYPCKSVSHTFEFPISGSHTTSALLLHYLCTSV